MLSLRSSLFAILLLHFPAAVSAFDDKPLHGFFNTHCYQCHDDNDSKGGLDLFNLGTDLSDPGTMQKWVRIFDRVGAGEMPPKDEPAPDATTRRRFAEALSPPLTDAHSKVKGTVLRRLNRHEYQNTLNDLFGTHLDLAGTLPEDGRSHEFDTVGEALGLSMVQLRRYLEAIDSILDASIAKTVDQPASKTIKASYADGKDLQNFIGTQWLKRPDGAVVFFQDTSYPTGSLREAWTDTAGYYKIRVTGYAYQSEVPVTFAVNADTFARGVEKPTLGYFSFAPGKPQTIELEAWIDERYMIQVKPWGIVDGNYDIKNKGVANYTGPGLAVQHIELEGPLVKKFPSRGHRLLFDGLERKEIEPSRPDTKKKSWYVPAFEITLPAETDPKSTAQPILKRVATKAFRRPVHNEEIAPYLDLFESQLALDASFEEALRTAVSAIFCAPDFIYLKETPGWLDNHALASRLAYFLTRTAPDDQLMKAIESRPLHGDPQALLMQADRLMASEHFERFVVDFTDSWLNLREINATSPDKVLFPEFDAYLQWASLQETRSFFRELITEDLSVTNLVQSDFAMLNDRLALHYGLEDLAANGPELRRVSLPADSVRGGFLTQCSILKVSANGTNTSPVLRGVWVMERLLGETPAPPPAGISGVEPDIRGATTLREKLALHRDSESCQSCHNVIDPPGFALENFNPIGTWRDRFRSLGDGDKVTDLVFSRRVQFKLGPAVDATGQTVDGDRFETFNQFRALLTRDPDRLARAFATKLLTFASGREMGFSDRPEIERIVAESAKHDHGIRHLFHLVIGSEIFRRK